MYVLTRSVNGDGNIEISRGCATKTDIFIYFYFFIRSYTYVSPFNIIGKIGCSLTKLISKNAGNVKIHTSHISLSLSLSPVLSYNLLQFVASLL